MTLNEFFSIITKDKYIEPYIVALKYKFDFEDEYTVANEYLDIDMNMPNHPYYPFIWLNDWNEGQTDIEVLGFKKLSELRIIEQEPKPGHWIEHKNNGITYIECSECSSWFLRMYLTRNSYCPNCGTKITESGDK